MGDVKKTFRRTSRFLSDLGESVYKPIAGEPTGKEVREQQKADAEAVARAEAEARQQEFEASTKAGLEALNRRRRRGFAASILAPTLGSTSTLGG